MSVVSSGTSNALSLPTSIDRLSTLPPEILLIIFSQVPPRPFHAPYLGRQRIRIGVNRKLIYFERLSIYRSPSLRDLHTLLAFLDIVEAVPGILPTVELFSLYLSRDPFDAESHLGSEKQALLRARLGSMLSPMTNLYSFSCSSPAIVNIFLASAHLRITTLSLVCFDISLATISTAFPLLVDLEIRVVVSSHSDRHSTLTSQSMIVPPRRQLETFRIECNFISPNLLDFIRTIRAFDVELSVSRDILEEALAVVDPTVEDLQFMFLSSLTHSSLPLASRLFHRFTSLRRLSFGYWDFELAETFFVDLFRSPLPLESLNLTCFTGYNANDLLAALALPHQLKDLSVAFHLDLNELSASNLSEETLDWLSPPVFTLRCPLLSIKMIVDRARGCGVVVEEDCEVTQQFMSKWEAAMLAAQERVDQSHSEDESSEDDG